MSSYPAITIDRFLGLNTSSDAYNVIPGQLSTCKNMVFLENGGLEKRGGSTKLADPPASGVVYALANYQNNAGNNYLITVQGTDAYYYSAGWNALSLTLTASQRTRFEQGGFSTNKNLYGVNGNNSIIKITTSGGVPVGSLISGTGIPTDGTAIKLHKNRMFVSSGDTLYFTNALAFDWTGTILNIQVAPGIDGTIKALEVWGDSLFIFKEKGVYVLPNASDPDPTSNWVILRTDARTGTLSPDTVRRTRIGIMYLATDNYIRLLSPTVSYSSGEYSLGESGSPVISETIDNTIRGGIDNANKHLATAVVKDDLYILTYKTSDNSDAYNDKCFFADTNKIVQLPNFPQPQPFWGEFTGLNMDYFAIQEASGVQKLYGALGDVTAALAGDVRQTLIDGTYNDAGDGITGDFALAWVPIAGADLYKKIKSVYVLGYTSTQLEVDVYYDTFKHGDTIPTLGTSEAFIFNTGGSDLSRKFRIGDKGHYFGMYFSNAVADENYRIYKLVVYYRPIKKG